MVKFDEPSKKPKKAHKQVSQPEDAKVQKPAVASAASRQELKARLQQKLDQFKVVRNVDNPKAIKRQELRKKKKEKRKLAKVEAKSNKQQSTPSAPAVVEAGRQIFSKFDFGLPEKKLTVTPKNPKQALQRLEARTKKLTALQATDEARAEQQLKNEAWSKAIQKAQGLQIKDDARLLKKAIAKEDKAKGRRTEKWEARQQAQKDAEAARQKKRQDNIDARKKQKVGGGQPAKKRPGFEGSHFKKIQKKKK